MTTPETITATITLETPTFTATLGAGGQARNAPVFRLGRIGEAEQTDGCYSTPHFHFPGGFWCSTTITVLTNGATGALEFYEIATQTMDGGVGSVDAVEFAIMDDPALDDPVLYLEATRIGDPGESIQFLNDPRYFSYVGWTDDGWRLPRNVPTRIACSLEYDVGGTWRGTYWRGVDEVDTDDLFVPGGALGNYYVDPDGRKWRLAFKIAPGDGVFPDQGPGSIILSVTEDFQIGRDIGMALHDEVEFRDGIGGTLLARPRASDAVGRRAFTDPSGKVWTPGPLAVAGTPSDIAAAIATESLLLAIDNAQRITALEEA